MSDTERPPVILCSPFRSWDDAEGNVKDSIPIIASCGHLVWISPVGVTFAAEHKGSRCVCLNCIGAWEGAAAAMGDSITLDGVVPGAWELLEREGFSTEAAKAFMRLFARRGDRG